MRALARQRLLTAMLLAGGAGWASAVVPARGQLAASGTVHTAAVDLHYDTIGRAGTVPPLFVVNGGPGLTHVYMVQNDLWQRVAKSRQVVFYDQRGDGQSTRVAPGAPQTMEAQVADLEAIRLAAGADRIDLLGDSFGGLVVLAYTLAHPEHVRRLVVSDGLPSFKAIVHPLPDVFPDIEADEAAALKSMPDGKQKEEYGLRIHMRECFRSPQRAAIYLNGVSDLGLNAAVGEQVGKAVADLDLSPQLSTIKTPTLILTGRFDMNVAPVTAWRMAQAIPGAQFHVFEDSGHLPSYEEPEAYLQTLTAFLER